MVILIIPSYHMIEASRRSSISIEANQRIYAALALTIGSCALAVIFTADFSTFCGVAYGMGSACFIIFVISSVKKQGKLVAPPEKPPQFEEDAPSEMLPEDVGTRCFPYVVPEPAREESSLTVIPSYRARVRFAELSQTIRNITIHLNERETYHVDTNRLLAQERRMLRQWLVANCGAKIYSQITLNIPQYFFVIARPVVKHPRSCIPAPPSIPGKSGAYVSIWERSGKMLEAFVGMDHQLHAGLFSRSLAKKIADLKAVLGALRKTDLEEEAEISHVSGKVIEVSCKLLEEMRNIGEPAQIAKMFSVADMGKLVKRLYELTKVAFNGGEIERNETLEVISRLNALAAVFAKPKTRKELVSLMSFNVAMIARWQRTFKWNEEPPDRIACTEIREALLPVVARFVVFDPEELVIDSLFVGEFSVQKSVEFLFKPNELLAKTPAERRRLEREKIFAAQYAALVKILYEPLSNVLQKEFRHVIKAVLLLQMHKLNEQLKNGNPQPWKLLEEGVTLLQRIVSKGRGEAVGEVVGKLFKPVVRHHKIRETIIQKERLGELARAERNKLKPIPNDFWTKFPIHPDFPEMRELIPIVKGSYLLIPPLPAAAGLPPIVLPALCVKVHEMAMTFLHLDHRLNEGISGGGAIQGNLFVGNAILDPKVAKFNKAQELLCRIAVSIVKDLSTQSLTSTLMNLYKLVAPKTTREEIRLFLDVNNKIFSRWQKDANVTETCLSQRLPQNEMQKSLLAFAQAFRASARSFLLIDPKFELSSFITWVPTFAVTKSFSMGLNFLPIFSSDKTSKQKYVESLTALLEVFYEPFLRTVTAESRHIFKAVLILKMAQIASDLTKIGQPNQKLDTIEEIFTWFEGHLKGALTLMQTIAFNNQALPVTAKLLVLFDALAKYQKALTAITSKDVSKKEIATANELLALEEAHINWNQISLPKGMEVVLELATEQYAEWMMAEPFLRGLSFLCTKHWFNWEHFSSQGTEARLRAFVAEVTGEKEKFEKAFPERETSLYISRFYTTYETLLRESEMIHALDLISKGKGLPKDREFLRSSFLQNVSKILTQKIAERFTMLA